MEGMENKKDNMEKRKEEDITELEGHGGKESWRHWRSHFHSNICLEGLRRTRRNINHDSQFPNCILKPGHPENRKQEVNRKL
jgi:hypothetical protein